MLIDARSCSSISPAHEVGLPLNWRYGPSSRDLGDASYLAATHTLSAASGAARSVPVHVRGTRSGGDVTITWVRRTRIGGDTWETPEVPLGEDAERYEIDILDGGTIKRTLVRRVAERDLHRSRADRRLRHRAAQLRNQRVPDERRLRPRNAARSCRLTMLAAIDGVPAMDQPLWLANAWAELGQREVAGAGDNPHIRAFFRDAEGTAMPDEVPWCAAFVGACLERARVASTRSLMARSYLRWGDALKQGRFGAIAVFSRGGDPSTGHVGFLIGETGEHIYLLGGNQGDAVTVAAMAKSRLLGLRWPQAPSTTHAEAKTDGGLFDRALAHVLEMEGGFTDDPYDPGGPTNFGITLRVYAEWKGVAADAALKAELQHIPDEAVRAIYLARYWRPAGCDHLPPALAFFHFDAAVNHGVTGATRLLQQAVGTDADGEIGPLTQAAIAARPVPDTLNAYADARRRRYRALPHFWRFGRGWLKRVDTALARALAIAATPSPRGDRAIARFDTTNSAARRTDFHGQHRYAHEHPQRNGGAAPSRSGARSSLRSRLCCPRSAPSSAST